MNVGSGKCHPGGPYCTYNEKTVPSLVGFSEGGDISVNILKKVLRHLDDLKLYDNDGKDGIIPALLFDGNFSHFDMDFEINV